MADRKLEQHSINIRGLRTAWLQAHDNNKPILLLLHGYPDTPESWSYQLEHYIDRFCIVAPYSRGTHPSEPAREVRRYDCPSTALDLLAILDKVDSSRKRPVIIACHDMGAPHAWYLSQVLGQRLRGLLVINGLSVAQMAQRFKNPKQHLRSWYMYAFQVPGLPERMLQQWPGKALKLAHRSGGLRPTLRPQIADTVRGLVSPINQYRAHARSLVGALREMPPRLDAPTLALWGEDDPFVSPPQDHEIGMWAKNYQIRVLPGQHWLHRESPELVNQTIDHWLQKEVGI